ncbi:unnamed protein product [Callosobruchus maculatus]|uniref:RING-type E3 ubiquitin transferase n=1 Tax=Callosobruchus maculatus TaxID=64391 RepID=A0A653CI12_CALMS|nr:unnamed protein product [Callosobruchus maculatus]
MGELVDEEFKVLNKDSLQLACTCHNCNKLLNVEPIYLVTDSKSDNPNIPLLAQICGRCKHVLKKYPQDNQLRQYAYENLARFLTYPCSNKKSGCTAVLNWDNILDHEIVCEFQMVLCPLNHDDIFSVDKCTWKGNVRCLNEHIERTHKEHIVTAACYNWTPPKPENSILFTHVGCHLVTVVVMLESKDTYYCLVMINGNDVESQCFRYQLELFDETREHSIILRKARLEPLGCMVDNLKNPDAVLEVDIRKIQEMLKNTKSIHGRFGIVKKNKKEIMQVVGKKDHSFLNGCITQKDKEADLEVNNALQLDDTMLQELECPICNEYMVPPIFICATGHSICSDCKHKIQQCPNCRSPLSNARNFTLEKLTTKVAYPCRNREIGCSFISTSTKIRSHELGCELSETSCIMGPTTKCSYKCLRPSMYSHIVEQHSSMLLEINTVQKRNVVDKREGVYVFYVGGELFRFNIKGSEQAPSYRFCMSHLGMVEGEHKYCYNLQILDQSNLGLHFSITQPCQCLTNRGNPNALTVPYDMLRPFVGETSYFNYKINIIKV